MQEKVLQTPSGDVRYWVSRHVQSGPWLVFLPGLSADHHLFDAQIDGLSARYRCLVWDAPGHGASRPFRLDFSMDDLADHLHAVLEQEGCDAPVLIGQSLGGYIAQAYIVRYPGHAAGFVSIDSCSLSRKYYTWWELALLKRTKWMYLSIPWKLLIAWGCGGVAVTRHGQEMMKRMWESYGKQEFCDLSDHGYRIFAQAVEAREAYRLDCPVLLLCGEKDAAGSARRYNRQWTRQDGFPLIMLKNAGHNANVDVPDEVNRRIDAFAGQLKSE